MVKCNLLYNRKKEGDYLYIRKAVPEDIPQILNIYEDARKYMRENGNLLQWNNGYPSEDQISTDINNEDLFIVCDKNSNEALCVFAFIKGPDITYSKIYEGNWPNDKPYYVIHRIAVSQHGKGIAGFVYNECLKKHPIIRIDTHKDNIPMQNSLKKNGFIYCGIIHLLNGDERMAYQIER